MNAFVLFRKNANLKKMIEWCQIRGGNDMYRIMLVEDDATIVDILSRQLEKWGYLVRAVQDFDRVMEEFREFQPQLVLMDLSLPFFNGYYWCTEIRKISRGTGAFFFLRHRTI